jgi:aminoglycoside 6'-N-acetyltransferase I
LESFVSEHISRLALDVDGTVLGWIGGIPHYRGHVWELKPLVVRLDRQGQGIGRADANVLGKPDILMATSVARHG